MACSITFLGAVGTVTGSKYLLSANDRKILVDCGLFQGFKQLRLRNWDPLPIAPESIEAVVLTHAHLDHSGYLPLLVRKGFEGPIFCTEATRDLCAILLPDSGYLQEKDADFANRHGYSKHKPALPLYSEADAKACLSRFEPQSFDRQVSLPGGSSVIFRHAGHILGAAILEIAVEGLRVAFSGDLGRPSDATMLDPEKVNGCDYLIVESTYGNRRHDPKDPEIALAETINKTAERGGTVLIPSFAVGRAQSLLFHISNLKASGQIPDLPVFLDSPMAVNASEIFCHHLAHHRLTTTECHRTCNVARYVRSVEESKSLDEDAMPKIIISASGMATGGRVLHHLKHFITNPRNTVLFAGFQAGGTRGAALTGGAKWVKIHGENYPVRAEVENLQMLSAHSDCEETIAWLRAMKDPPKKVFVTHGEPPAAEALRTRIEEELGWNVDVPEYRDHISLN